MPSADGITWMSLGGGELVRFDTTQATYAPAAFPALIRQVTTNHAQRLFGGATVVACGSAARGIQQRAAFRVLGCEPSLTKRPPSTNRGSTGSTTTGRQWTREARRDYTNLGFGEYRFRVRARSVTGQIGEEAAYAFTILPPVVSHMGAYAGYLLLAGLAMFGVDRHPAPPRDSQGARARAVCRSEAPRGIRRGAGVIRDRGQEERRAAQRDRARDHVVARVRHDLRKALRARESAGRRGRVRRRALPS